MQVRVHVSFVHYVINPASNAFKKRYVKYSTVAWIVM